MISFPSLFLLIPCLIFVAKSEDSYFSSPFLEKIDKITKAVQENVVNIDEKYFYFNEMEGSGEELLTKGEAAQQLRLVVLAEQARMTDQSNLQLDLGTLGRENVNIVCSLGKYLTEVPEVPQNQFKKYLITFSHLEDSVMGFLAETVNETARLEIVNGFGMPEVRDGRAALWDNRDPKQWQSNMVEPTLAEVLKRNKFMDDVFSLFFRLLKNHAKVMTVATIIEQTMDRNSELLSQQVPVQAEYEQFIQFISAVNEWRDFHGFKFNELFTEIQLEDFGNLTDLPLPEHQNLFTYDPKREDFVNKYFYFTAKACGVSSQIRFSYNSRTTQVVAMHKNNCTSEVFRRIRQSHPNAENFSDTSAIFKRLAKSHFRNMIEPVEYDYFPSANRFVIFGRIPENLDLMAVAVYRDNGIHQVYDNVDQGGFVVPASVFVTNHKKDKKCLGTFIRDCREEVIETKIALRILGYFLVPGQTIL